ncbi:DNA-directed RNA polymerase subunit alpha [Candidatus Roizmanbacteria bacterium RIFCSPHIGHO2_02_FULL_40_9]|uniref:DNA-directed RNA polymerase subunit alpha n=2 Tax=Candidatus Roizmaniibacteriota TaxID=1752723 RepID=A0A1F7IL03_9BACT|nr:MAG: DNA-directed RNA polymerase subunit alpha [Candidatus Roizmanbacteria bacterium RIFCSPHIGHO2_02_FULL_40_9]OGK44056.1 MAG: DNA-directed RNA polymerase subunit alpha [Candidatus Roizmanbacteria bacterium RIFCSPLOWO2_01_FULL_38_11]
MLKPTFTTKKADLSSTYGKFTISPLPAGFGHSMGNALRRALMSSIEGASATYVKINDVVHPFSTLKGIKESGLDIILNLKALRFNPAGKGPFAMSLTKKGKGMVHAADFKGGDIEIVNSDLMIAELTTSDAKLDIELTIERGLGYSPSEEKEKKEFGVLAVDSLFSPVVKVNYRIEDERVGRKTNFDRLTLEIWTDGTINPEEALRQSSMILSEFFMGIYSENSNEVDAKNSASEAAEQQKSVDDKVYEIIIDELDLPTRVINALLREKIETVGDLVERGEDVLANLKGVGRKSISLIENELKKLGISLELK